MAKRFTDTEKWKKPFYRLLPPKLKCLWDYITADCDLAGLWHVDLQVAAIRIGESITEQEAIGAFKDHIIIVEGEEQKWFIPSFIEFQYGSQLSKNNNVYKAIKRILDKYDLYKYLTVDIVEAGTTISAHRDRLSKKMKEAVYLKFDLTCQYCQEQHKVEDLVVDHFVPLNRGGDNSDENLVCSCKRCNQYKSDILPDKFLNKDHKFLNPSDFIYSLLGAFNKLKGGDNVLEGDLVKDKDKDQVKDMVKDKVKEEDLLENFDDPNRLAYNVEETVLGNQIWFEQLCMSKGFSKVSAGESLRKYHLYLVENDKYPMKRKSLFAGYEKWIMNEQKGKSNYPLTKASIQPVDPQNQW